MSIKFEDKPPFYLGILGAHCRSVTWPRQSGISGPRSTAPAELRGGASFCSTAAAGSSAGDLSGSTEEGGGRRRLIRLNGGFGRLNSGIGRRGCLIRLDGRGRRLRVIQLNCRRLVWLN